MPSTTCDSSASSGKLPDAFQRVVPTLATVRGTLKRSARYAMDDQTYVHTGSVGDHFLVFMREEGSGILTRRFTDTWAELPNMEWIRAMMALGRFRPLGPSSAGLGSADPRPAPAPIQGAARRADVAFDTASTRRRHRAFA